MKLTIVRQFSFTNKRYEIICNGKTVASAKATHSRQYQDQYNLELSNLIAEYVGEDSCLVESHSKKPHHYFIYSINHQTNEKMLFGRLSYEMKNSDNTYKIIIGRKFYSVRSSDLKDRRLTMIDTIENNSNYPKTLFQLIDSFSKINQKYHVNIHESEWSLGYLAMTILLHLHESQRDLT